MAIYNEILSARFARMLQRIFSMKGEQAMKQLSGELMPVIPFFTGVENRYLEGWQRYGTSFTVAAAAGFLSKIRLRNPSRTNLAVIEKILLSNATGVVSLLTVRIAGGVTTDLASIGSLTNSQLDLRGPATSSLIISSQNTDGALQSGTPIFDANLAAQAVADAILTDDQELVLVNGNVGGAALHITNETPNTLLQGSIVWRERPLEESEQGP